MEGKNSSTSVISNSVSFFISLGAVYIVVLVIYRVAFLQTIGLPSFNFSNISGQIFVYEPLVFYYSLFPWLMINIGFSLFKNTESWREILAYALGLGSSPLNRIFIFILGLYTPYVFYFITFFLINRTNFYQKFRKTEVILHFINVDLQISEVWFVFFSGFIALVGILLYLKSRQTSISKISFKTLQRRKIFFQFFVPWSLSVTILIFFFSFPTYLGVFAAKNSIVDAEKEDVTSIVSDRCICGWCYSNGQLPQDVDLDTSNGKYTYFFSTSQNQSQKTIYLGKLDNQLIIIRTNPKASFFTLGLFPEISKGSIICVINGVPEVTISSQ